MNINWIEATLLASAIFLGGLSLGAHATELKAEQPQGDNCAYDYNTRIVTCYDEGIMVSQQSCLPFASWKDHCSPIICSAQIIHYQTITFCYDRGDNQVFGPGHSLDPMYP